MNQIKKYICPLLFLLLISCMSDDYTDCPSGFTRVRVLYNLELLPEMRTVESGVVESVDLYLFDSNGILISWLNDQEPDLSGETYFMEATLPYGTYEAVSWINLANDYQMEPANPQEGVTIRGEAKISMKKDENGNVTENLVPLYYALQKEITLAAGSVPEDGYLTITLSPELNTNTLNIFVTGGEPGETYELTVTDDNGCYDFDNSIVPGEELHYITTLGADATELLTGTLTVGKLSRNRTPVLRIKQVTSGELVYEASLIALLTKGENEDDPIHIEETHLFDVTIDITRSPEAPVPVRIGFSWPEPANNGREGIIASQARKLDLFIFDSEGFFKTHIQDENMVLSAAYYLEAELPAGIYTLVSWLNLIENYGVNPEINKFTPGVTTINEAYVALETSGGVANVISGSPLIYGSVDQKNINNLLSGADGFQHLTLPLTQNTYDLSITLTGVLREADYHLELVDNYGQYGFDNSFAISAEEIRYQIITGREAGYRSDISVERLERGRQPVFSVKTPAGKQLYQSNLIDLILKHETGGGLIDFGKTYRFDIVLEFIENEEGEISVEVTINGWKVNEEEGQLG